VVGSLDNVDDISERLAISRQSEPAVVQSAWRRWGSGLGAHLLGDYVLIVSDERERHVAAIRSPLGQHSFFYGVTPHAVVFGSDVDQVVRHPAIPTGVDEGMAAEYLAAAPNTVRDTLWRGVHRLPPGHTLEIADGILRETRHWDFDPQTSLSCRRPEEFADQLHELFARSVRCCLGDGRRAGVYLSGGIDSSVVAGVAQTMAVADGRDTVHAFTLAFPGRACDETAYSQAVVDKWGLRLTRLNARPLPRSELERMTRE
jgi:asparagine synthase (glutamine-hydrolysing)